jgi:hypothetical protein
MKKLTFSSIERFSLLLLLALLTSFTVEQVVQGQPLFISSEDQKEEERSLEWDEEKAEWEKEKELDPTDSPPLEYHLHASLLSPESNHLWIFAQQQTPYAVQLSNYNKSCSCPRYIKYCCLRIHLS